MTKTQMLVLCSIVAKRDAAAEWDLSKRAELLQLEAQILRDAEPTQEDHDAAWVWLCSAP